MAGEMRRTYDLEQVRRGRKEQAIDVSIELNSGHQQQRQVRRRRLFDKRGNNRAAFTHLSSFNYARDLFHTIIDIKWRYLISIYICTYVLTWTGFGTLWWLLMRLRGDFRHLSDDGRGFEDGYTPCVMNAYSWHGCFLFSLETQTTIGYGFRVISETCTPGFFLLNFQSIATTLLEATVLGVVLAKIGRSKMRSATLKFSHWAVVEQDADGRLCFSFRVADLRAQSNIAEPHVRAYYIPPSASADPGSCSTRDNDFHIAEMDYGFSAGLDRLFFPTPLVVRHVVDERSPLYGLSQASLERMSAGSAAGGELGFEIVVVLEGTVTQTGNTEQFRTSYTPDEVRWGHRFLPCGWVDLAGNCVVDYSRFDCTASQSPQIGPLSQAERDAAAAAAQSKGALAVAE